MHEPTRRLTLLRNAVSLLRTLQSEMPGSAILIGQAIRSVSVIVENYEQQERELAELHESTRKPPKRARKKHIAKTAAGQSVVCNCNDPGCTRSHIDGPMDNSNVGEENQG